MKNDYAYMNTNTILMEKNTLIKKGNIKTFLKEASLIKIIIKIVVCIKMYIVIKAALLTLLVVLEKGQLMCAINQRLPNTKDVNWD